MAEHTQTNSAKRRQRQQFRPERRQEPEGQKWQSWVQTLPMLATWVGVGHRRKYGVGADRRGNGRVANDLRQSPPCSKLTLSVSCLPDTENPQTPAKVIVRGYALRYSPRASGPGPATRNRWPQSAQEFWL